MMQIEVLRTNMGAATGYVMASDVSVEEVTRQMFPVRSLIMVGVVDQIGMMYT